LFNGTPKMLKKRLSLIETKDQTMINSFAQSHNDEEQHTKAKCQVLEQFKEKQQTLRE
jgi:hypothetical protein